MHQEADTRREIYSVMKKLAAGLVLAGVLCSAGAAFSTTTKSQPPEHPKGSRPPMMMSGDRPPLPPDGKMPKMSGDRMPPPPEAHSGDKRPPEFRNYNNNK